LTVSKKQTFDQVFNEMMRELPTQMPLREKVKAITRGWLNKIKKEEQYQDDLCDDFFKELLGRLE